MPAVGYTFPETFGWQGYAEWLDHFAGARKVSTAHLLDFSGSCRGLPEGILPLITHLDRQRAQGHAFQIEIGTPARALFRENGWEAGLNGDLRPQVGASPSNSRLRCFTTAEEQNDLVREMLEIALHGAILARGVLDALTWGINELMDNVLVHAQSPIGGLTQCVYSAQRKSVSFTVVDTGRGVLRSIREGYNANSDEAALRLAVEEGVTRDREVGAGRGLTGALNITKASRGRFLLHSGSAYVKLRNNKIWSEGKQGWRHRGTIVHFELSTQREIDVARALWGVPLESHLRLTYEDDDLQMRFRVALDAQNFGNRATGRRLRNKLTNMYGEFRGKRLIVDFSGIPLVSSSFADEFIAKFAVRIGTAAFEEKVGFVGLSDINRLAIEQSCERRFRAPGRR